MAAQDSDLTSTIFETIIDNFIQRINGLISTLPSFKGFLQIFRDAKKQAYIDFLDKNAVRTEISSDGNEKTYYLPPHVGIHFLNLQRDFESTQIVDQIMPESFVVTLVSQFDLHFAKLVKAMFVVKPDLISSSQKGVSPSEITNFSSIEELKEHMIEKEVEGILRESHSEYFHWLEGKLNIPLRKDLDIWPDFVELTERRNLFVHSGGVVTSQYIKVCKENNVDLPANVKVGTKLIVTQEYFVNACKCIFELGVKLGHVVWRKLIPDERSIADKSINLAGYNLIHEQVYDLAIKILDFGATEIKSHSSDEARLMMLVNLAQAYKWLDNKSRLQDYLSKIDWSALDAKFKLAKAVLIDDFVEASVLMRRIGVSDEIERHDYAAWPLFKEFRKTTEFKSAYKDVFGEEYQDMEMTPGKIVFQLGDNEDVVHPSA